MKNKNRFLIGLPGIMLILFMIFGCGDLGNPDEPPGPGPQPSTNAAETPVATVSPPTSVYTKDAAASTLTVTAAVSAGDLTYQWYTNTTLSASGGQEIPNANGNSYTPFTAEAGDFYYYVVVTNTDTTKDTPTVTAASNIAWIRVTDPATPMAAATLLVNTGTKYQWVRGFGGMMNGWDNSPPMSTADIDTAFSQDGLGLNIFRVMIYPYMDNLFNGMEKGPPSEPDAHQFYYNRIRRAQSHGATILASPWTMPGEWKTNGTRLTGYLKPEHWADYANHLKNYIDRMARNNAPIDFISIQNEPDIGVSYDGCEWTPEDNRDFIKQYGRFIAPKDGTVKIAPGESYQFREPFFSPMYDDPAAMDAVDVVAGHIYGGGLRRHTRAIDAGKEVWMTEHLYNTASNYYLDSQWQSVWLMADEFHDLMENDYNAIVWWYIKRFYNLIGDGEYGTVNGRPLFRGYALSHYAKYASNKTRINVKSAGATNVTTKVTAYDSDTEITLVFVNNAAAVNGLNIVLPVAVANASMVVTKGDNDADNDPTGNAMQAGTITLNPDNKTAVFDLPASSIVSVRFIK